MISLPEGSLLGALWQQATPAERREALLLVLLMLVGTVLEVVGIGAVVPIVALLTGAEPAGGRILGPLAGALHLPANAAAREALVIPAMLGLVALFAIKGLFQTFASGRIAAFSYGVQRSLSHDLLAVYLDQPQVFHLARNAGQLASTVNNEARDAATGINTLLTVLAEGLTLGGAALLLALLAPPPALGAAALAALVGGAMLLASRRAMAREGERMRREHALKMQWLQQALTGLKEIQLLGRQQGVLAAFERHNRAQSDAARRHARWNALPRVWLECVAVAALAGVVVAMHGGAHGPVVPVVGLFAAAAFRLVPSAYRLINGLQALGYLTPTLRHVLAERALPRLAPAAPESASLLPLTRELRLEALTLRHAPGVPPILDGLDLTIAAGTMTALVGPSGAGKSTLIDLVTGLLQPDSGRILTDGMPIAADLRAWQARIGLVPQTIFLIDETLRRNIALGIPDAQIDEAAVRRAVELASLGALVAELPQGLDTPLADRGQRLSGGQRQRVALARALYQAPQLLIMDEGTSALDAATESAIVTTLHRLRGTMTVLVATHRPEIMQLCDAVIRLPAGD